ncbi:MAG: hypothetical protein ORN54_11715 [Cyclobacteriaceae bacterium]|nr:hypothetical protein [Cyclobacteriaceae bacterium]
MRFIARKRERNFAGLMMVLVLCFIDNFELHGQTTLIKLVDSTRVSTDIINVSSRSLFTEAGSFNLTEIYSVTFSSEIEYQKKVSVARFLNEFGIVIYIKEIKLRPAPKDVVAANRRKYADEDKLVISKSSGFSESEYSYFRFGAGLGIDYGGFGARLTVLPSKYVGVFLASGYALAGFGVNGGIMVKTAPDSRVSPYFNMIYGYNAAIAIVGASQYNKLYNGLSLGGGVQLKSQRTPTNYWLFGLVVAFRSSEFDRDFTTLQNNPTITGLTKPLPVNISVGYHFAF